MHTFDTLNPVKLKVELWEGEVKVYAEHRETTTVELEPLRGDSDAEQIISQTRVEQRGDEVLILMPKHKASLFRGRRPEVLATIRLPLGSSAKIETESADVETHGELGNAKVATGSGEVRVEFGLDVEVKTGSGDISIGATGGNCVIRCGSADVAVETIGGDGNILSGSGDVMIDQVGGVLEIKTGSGDILVKRAGAGIDAMAGSGDLLVRRVDHGRLKAKTGSGDVQVGVADGTAAYLDIMTVTGDVRSSLDASEGPSDGDLTVELIIQSGSGDVVLQRA